MYAKTVKFPSSFLYSSFVKRETKEAFCFSNVFFVRYILKMKRKLAKKYRETFNSYQFVGHMPKIRGIWAKKKKKKDQPKIRHRLDMPRPFKWSVRQGKQQNYFVSQESVCHPRLLDSQVHFPKLHRMTITVLTFKDVRAHCSSAFLLRTLFIRHARATSYIKRAHRAKHLTKCSADGRCVNLVWEYFC